MKLGISTKCFGGIPSAQAAQKISEYGYEAVELCLCQSDAPFWHYNCAGNTACPQVEDFLKICDCYRNSGLEIASLGICPNLWCGGEEAERLARKSFAEYLELALAAGVDTISMELGFSISSRPIRGSVVSRKSYGEGDVRKLERAFCFAAMEAAKRGLTLAIEPCDADPISNAACESADEKELLHGDGKKYISFFDRIEQMSGTKDVFGLVLCPFSFCEVDEYEAGAFEELAGRTRLLYVKERCPDARFFTHAGANAGTGFGLGEWKDFFSMFPGVKFAVAEYADDRNAGNVCKYISGAVV